jgi:hypothetical protein
VITWKTGMNWRCYAVVYFVFGKKDTHLIKAFSDRQIWGEVVALNCRMSAMNPIFTDLVNLKESKRPTGKDLRTRRENATNQKNA